MSTFLSLGLGCTSEMLSAQEKVDFAAAFDYAQKEVNSRGYLIHFLHMFTRILISFSCFLG